MNDYGMTIITGTLKALSPCHHGGNEKTGSVSLLNRQKWIVDGEPVSVPYISGNAIRGQLRRKAMYDFTHDIGYTIDLDSIKGRKLYHALFTGGNLEQVKGPDAGTINLELKRRIYDMIPYARLFGFAFGNQMIESIMKVGQMLPVCTELRDFLPKGLEPKMSFYNLISQNFQTRKDDIIGTREADEGATQMLIDYESFAAGTVFSHEFRLEDATPIDLSAFARILNLWHAKPSLGARSGTGFGNVRIEYDLDKNIDSALYDEHIDKNGKEIRDLMDELQKL